MKLFCHKLVAGTGIPDGDSLNYLGLMLVGVAEEVVLAVGGGLDVEGEDVAGTVTLEVRTNCGKVIVALVLKFTPDQA